MLGRHHGVLRRRLVVGGVEARRQPATIRNTVRRCAISTVETSSAAGSEATTDQIPPPEPQADQDVPKPQAPTPSSGATVRISHIRHEVKKGQGQKDEGQKYMDRRAMFSDWMRKKRASFAAEARGASPTKAAESTEEQSATATAEAGQLDGEPVKDIVKRQNNKSSYRVFIRPDRPQGDPDPDQAPGLAGPSFRLRRKGLRPEVPSMAIHYGFNRSSGKFISRDGHSESEEFKEIVGMYFDSKNPAKKWQPDEIESREKSMELLDRADRALSPIDQSLRQKLLSRYKGVPRAETSEAIDLDSITTAFTQLKIPEQNEAVNVTTASFRDKFEPLDAEKLRRAEEVGLRAQVDLSHQTIASLTPDEWVILLQRMNNPSVVANAEKILRAFEEKRIFVTKQLAESLIIPLAHSGRVKEVQRMMRICDSAGINMNYSFLLRAYRIASRSSPDIVQEITSLVPQIAKAGFDERGYGSLMQIYAESGRRDLAVALFNNYESFVASRPLKTAHIHNSLLFSFKDSGMAEEAEYIYQAMVHQVDDAPLPDHETYGLLAQIYERRPDYYGKLLLLVKNYLASGLGYSGELFGALMKSCASAGRLDATLAIFDKMMSKPDLRPSRDLMRDYLLAMLQAKVNPSDETQVSVGLPVYDKLPVDPLETLVVDSSLSTVGEGEGPTAATDEIKDEEDMAAVPQAARLDPKHEKYQIPKPPVPPHTAGELLALVDLQYQHLRKFQPQLTSINNQRLFLRLFVSHGFYETFKKAYRWLAVSTGFRNKKSIFPAYQKRTKVSFSDFAKGSAQLQADFDPSERYEFDYLHQPLSQLEVFPAMRAAFETKDLEFAQAAIQDYDQLVRDFPDALSVRPKVREAWMMLGEAMIINTLAHCGHIEAAFQRFSHAMETITWDVDRPRLFGKRIGVFTGVLVSSGLDDMAARVFRTLQTTEWHVQEVFAARSGHSRGIGGGGASGGTAAFAAGDNLG